MKTLILILSLAFMVTATPIATQKNVNIMWPVNENIMFPEIINRQKKSSGHEVTSLSSTQNIENQDQDHHDKTSPRDSITDDRTTILRQPITITNKSAKNSQENLAETGSDEKCKLVKLNLCKGKNEDNTNNPATSFQAHTDKLVSGKKIEDSIKFAKEAMDSLTNDIHKIEQTSLNSHAETDDNLHTKLEVARQALDHIQENFGNLETMKNAINKPLKDVTGATERDNKLAKWQEMVDTVQTTGGLFKNTEDLSSSNRNQNSRLLMKTTDTTTLEGDHDLNPEDIGQLREIPIASSKIDLINTESTSTPEVILMKDSENHGSSKLDKLQENSDQAPAPSKHQKYYVTSIDPKKFEMTPTEREVWLKFHPKQTGTNKQNETKVPEIGPNAKVNPLNNKKVQDTESGMPKSVSDQSSINQNLPISEVIKNQEKEISKLITSGIEQRSGSLTTTDNKLSRKIEQTVASHDHEAHSTGVAKAADIPFNHRSPKNDIDVVQNANQNVQIDLPEQHTFEDLELMRWADERQDVRTTPLLQTNSNLQNERLKSTNMDEHLRRMMTDTDLSSHEHLPIDSDIPHHIHSMLQMKSSDIDSAMQPSIPLGMRDTFGRSALDYNTMQWNHPSMARMSYGSSGGSSSSSSSSGSGGTGAVGVFPNANVGGCAIPLLLSCSPSLISGSLAKSAGSASGASQSGYAQPPPPSPSYRSGDELTYYMKRDTKLNEEVPIVKVLRTNTPFNHKHELILDRKYR